MKQYRITAAEFSTLANASEADIAASRGLRDLRSVLHTEARLKAGPLAVTIECLGDTPAGQGRNTGYQIQRRAPAADQRAALAAIDNAIRDTTQRRDTAPNAGMRFEYSLDLQRLNDALATLARLWAIDPEDLAARRRAFTTKGPQP